jgi:hypothetical protein
MVRWHIWHRITGRRVTVTGKRREVELLITIYDASSAAELPVAQHARLTDVNCGTVE